MKKKFKIIVSIIIASMLLNACNVPILKKLTKKNKRKIKYR